MAHFAKLGVNGKVIAVHVLDNKDMLNADNQEDESVGQNRLQEIHGWPAQMWIQTSYNTRGGKHYDADGNLSSDQSKALRGNYAGIGYSWDEDNKLFFGPQPHASWSKNTTTAGWDAPITYPTVENYTEEDSSTQRYNIYWNETAYQANNAKGWEATRPASSDVDKVYEWNSSSKSWSAQ